MSAARTDAGTVTLPTKQVNPISPLLPISVLIVTSAQAYNIMHRHCLSSPHVQTWIAQCEANPGQFLSYKSLRTLDTVTCVLVKFFAAAWDDSASKALCSEFMALFGIVTLIMMISSNRSSAGSFVRWGSTIVFLLMQILGAGVVLPVYLSVIVYNGSRSARASFIPSGWARALLPTLIVAYLLPSMSMMIPSLFTARQQEIGIALWQPFPVYVSAIAAVLALLFTGSGTAMSTSDAMVSTTLIVSSMDFMVLVSVLCHIYAISIVYTAGTPLSAFIPLSNLPTPASVSHGFLTFDMLAVLVSLWTLIFYDTTRFAGVGKTSIISAALIAVVGTVVLGPGGAAAWAWSNVEKARLGALVADRPRKSTEPVTANSA